MTNPELRRQVTALLTATQNAIYIMERSNLYVRQGSPEYNTIIGLAETMMALTDTLNRIPTD